MSVARWTDPRFIGEVHRWLGDTCDRLGLTLAGPIEQPHVRPWSTVFRARASGDTVHLKVCGPSQIHEPALTVLLAREFAGITAVVLAVHPTEPWMLVADAGAKLRDAFTGTPLLAQWEAILPRYAELQRAMVARERELLSLGTPDRRLTRLATDLDAALEDEAVLRVGRPDGLSEDERGRLRALLPRIDALCAELASAGIGASIQHDDLHDGNVLVGRGRLVVFDWGDACLTHPFMTLTVTLRVAAHRVGLDERAPEVLRLRDAYLEPWTAVAPLAELREAGDLASRLGTISRALSWYDLVTKVDGALASEPDAIPSALRRALDALS